MREAIVYFYKLAGKSAKRSFWEQPVFLEERTEMTETLCLIKIGIPEYYYKKKNWTAGRLNRELEKKILQMNENIIFRAADNNCQDFVDLPEERIPWEFIDLGLQRFGEIEGLLILEAESEETENLVEKYAAHLNFLGIQTEREYEELEEALLEEYGLTIHIGTDAAKFFFPPMKKLLVVDMGVPPGKLLKKLPEKTIYFDVRSDEAKKKRILQKRNDIQYAAVLDTIRKNGYNTGVN